MTIVIGIILFALATMLLYGIGLKRKATEEKRLNDMLLNNSARRVLKYLKNHDYVTKDDMFICMCMSAVALLVLLIMLFVTKMHGLFAAFLALVYGTVLLLTVAHLTDDNIFLSFGLAIIFGLFLFGRKFLIFQLAVLILCLVFSAYRWYREVNYLKCQKQSEEYYQKVIQPLKEKERQELIREFEKKYHKKLYL